MEKYKTIMQTFNHFR